MTRRVWISSVVLGVLATGAIFIMLEIRRDAHAQEEAYRFLNVLMMLCGESVNRNGRLPPPSTLDADGNVLYGWRMPLLLPAYQTSFDHQKPWHAAENQQLEQVGIGAVADENLAPTVMAIVGKGTAYDEAAEFPESRGRDTVIVLVEVHGQSTHWMSNADIDVMSLCSEGTQEMLGGTYGQGYLVGFLNGEVWRLRSDTPCVLVGRYARLDEPFLPRDYLEPYRLE